MNEMSDREPLAASEQMPGLTARELEWYRTGWSDALIWASQKLNLSLEDEELIEEMLDDDDA